MLKGLIVLLMIALLITLGAGLYFLMIDQGDVKKTRLVNSLRVRATSFRFRYTPCSVHPHASQTRSPSYL